MAEMQTFVSLAVTVALWLYGALWIGTAGSPEVVIIIMINNNFFNY